MDGAVKALLFDLDGTVYRGTDPIPGAAAFIAGLAARGVRALFVTNRANRGPDEVAAHLNALGIACHAGDVITSAEVAAAEVAGQDVFLVGENALQAAVTTAGARLVSDPAAAEAVVMGFDRDLNLEKFVGATRAVLAGARLIATNPDALVNQEDGVTPGNGAFVAVVETATGARAQVMGKPEPAIVALALARAGVAPDEAVMIGDNLDTDIRAGQRAGLRTALILTGVSTAADAAAFSPSPTWTVRDYEELSAALFG